VADEVTMRAPKPAEWHLQSDTPFTGDGTRYRNGDRGSAAIAITLVAPADALVSTGVATVKAPGPPGSIEKGPEERRGFQWLATAPAASSFRFDVRLEIVQPAGSRTGGEETR
jgi:hypothetical protein